MKIYKDRHVISGFRIELPEGSGHLFSHYGESLLLKDALVGRHQHKTWELLLQMKGTSRWSNGPEDMEVSEGELLICPPGFLHEKRQKEKVDFRICFTGCQMDPELWPLLKHHLSERRMIKITEAKEIERSLHLVEEELVFNKPLQKKGLILAWKQLWLAVYRLAASPKRAWQPGEKWLAQRVRTLVEAEPGEKWTLKAISRFMGYAPNYFAELFKSESGQSFHQFLMGARMKAAQSALEKKTESITDIAFRLGFSSSQHFSRVFAEKNGITPSQWRKEKTS